MTFLLRAALVASSLAGLIAEPALAAAWSSPQAPRQALSPPVPRADLERLERGEMVLLAAEERAAGTAAAAVLIRATIDDLFASRSRRI